VRDRDVRGGELKAERLHLDVAFGERVERLRHVLALRVLIDQLLSGLEIYLIAFTCLGQVFY